MDVNNWFINKDVQVIFIVRSTLAYRNFYLCKNADVFVLQNSQTWLSASIFKHEAA